ncbi:MAG TPA: type II toxin-antitoxin system prevent-host-death family antitoxin [Caldilineae bacterium]|nr:type II toxin-antitoxin system prevent-host-death family antitoxin [Caldilineae bacterium]
MEKTIGIAKARESFSELVNRVAFGGERYVVERRGKAMAALISAAEYKQLMALLAEAGINDEIHGIPVRIRFDGDQYFVSDDILDLYGVGRTLDEAREDYWLAVRDYYEDLLTHADHLAGHLQEHLDFLRQIFAEDTESTMRA